MTPNLPASLRGANDAGEVVVFHPETGEALILSDAAVDDLAAWKASAKEWIASAQSAIRLVDQEIVSRMDRAASWTIQTRAGKLRSVSPTPEVSWKDPEGLRRNLLAMADAGLLDREVVDAALPVVPEHVSSDGRKLAALAKLDTAVGELVRSHRVESPRESRGVSLS